MKLGGGNGGRGFFKLKPGETLFGAKKQSALRKINVFPEKTMFDQKKQCLTPANNVSWLEIL